MKKCGLLIRVSTNEQYKSFNRQLETLQNHIKKRNAEGKEEWVLINTYSLKGVSGKISLREETLPELFDDIRNKAINTLLCVDDDRLSRSQRDFWNFREDLILKHNVDVISLGFNISDLEIAEQNVMLGHRMADAQYEREKNSARVTKAFISRSAKGWFLGGQQFLGYDIKKTEEGTTLIPNDEEKIIVNFAFDEYLRTGSVYATTESLNKAGYTTKEYTSKRRTEAGKEKGKIYHPARKFAYSTVRILLSNYAYIGKKEFRKKYKNSKDAEERKKYQVFDAKWPAIVDEEKFKKVQELLIKNNKTKHNAHKELKYNYRYGGIITCGKCNSQMVGSSSTGKMNVKYFYYVCQNQDCRHRERTWRIRQAVTKILGNLSRNEKLLSRHVKTANKVIQKQLPELQKRKGLKEKELVKVSKLIEIEFGEITTDKNRGLIKAKLDELADRKRGIEEEITNLNLSIKQIQGNAFDKELMKLVLDKYEEIFEIMKPWQQKEIIKKFVGKIIVMEDEIKVGLTDGSEVCQTLSWQAWRDSNPQPTVLETATLTN